MKHGFTDMYKRWRSTSTQTMAVLLIHFGLQFHNTEEKLRGAGVTPSILY